MEPDRVVADLQDRGAFGSLGGGDRFGVLERDDVECGHSVRRLDQVGGADERHVQASPS